MSGAPECQPAGERRGRAVDLAVAIADATVMSDIECYAARQRVAPPGEAPFWAYDLERGDPDLANGGAAEAAAEALLIARLAATETRRRPRRRVSVAAAAGGGHARLVAVRRQGRAGGSAGGRSVNRAAALRKVLACLRLAASSNPNEAAAALRQAQAMMAKYGLTEDDALASEIRNVSASTGFRGGMVPGSLIALATLVGSCYRCKPVVVGNPGLGKTTFEFFGGGADAEIAAYAYTVLQRQLRAAKAKHTARIRKRANKERRAEEFAAGWVYAITRLLPPAQPEGDLARSIDRAIAAEGVVGKTSGKQPGKGGRASADDFARGYRAGKNAHLHNGVAGAAARQLEYQS